MKEVLSAVTYCHKYGIVHRDLKPENILYQTKQPDSPLKIIDFGTSKNFEKRDKLTDICGTPYYIAPEVLDGSGHSFEVDLFSLGVIFYELVCGTLPFGEEEKDPIKVY